MPQSSRTLETLVLETGIRGISGAVDVPVQVAHARELNPEEPQHWLGVWAANTLRYQLSR